MQGMVPSVEHLGSLLPSLRLATLGTYSYGQVWEGKTRCSVVGSWLPVQGSRSPSHQSTTPRKGRQARQEVPGCAGTSRLPLSNGRRHTAHVPKPQFPDPRVRAMRLPSLHLVTPQSLKPTPARLQQQTRRNRWPTGELEIKCNWKVWKVHGLIKPLVD